MMWSFREPTTAELLRFYDAAILPKIEYAEALFLDAELVAIGGVLADPNLVGSPIEEVARTVAFLDVKRELPKRVAIDVILHLRSQLSRRSVWVQHDDAFPQSERLLRVLGFKPTREMRSDFKNTGRQLRMWCRPPRIR